MKVFRAQWGPWQFHQDTMTLEYKNGKKDWWYEVDLDRCKTSAQILDWIFQLHEKTWTDYEDIGHLLDAFDDLSGSVQGAFCSGGREQGPKDWRKLRPRAR